jgi:putative peptidoglycan lipid II flippase
MVFNDGRRARVESVSQNGRRGEGSRDAPSIDTSLRSAGWVSLWSAGQLAVQFALQMVLAKYFGAREEMDAFVSAIALPTVLSAIFVGSLSFALVPVFSQRLSRNDPAAAWSVASGLFWIVLCFTGLLAGCLTVLSVPATRVLYPGFDPPQAEQTSRLVAVLAWLLVGNGLIAFSVGILHAQKRFLVPAVAPVLGTAVTLAGTVGFREHGIQGVAYAVLAGSLVAAAIQLAALPLSRMRWRRVADHGVAECLWLLFPIVCGAVFYRLDPLVDRYLASELPAGSIAHLGYAMRLVTALTMIGTSGLAVVAFPNFARRYAQDGLDGLSTEVAHALRCLCVIMLPILVGLGCYSLPVIRALFERGEFTAQDTRAVAWLLVLYLGMVAAGAFGDLAAKTFFALGNTRLPTVIGCVGFAFGLVLKIALTDRWGVSVIAAATSLYFVGNASAMLAILYRKFGGSMVRGLGSVMWRALLASSIAVLVAYPAARSGVSWHVFLAAGLGAVVYLGLLLWFRDEFAWRMVGYFGELARLGRRRRADESTAREQDR